MKSLSFKQDLGLKAAALLLSLLLWLYVQLQERNRDEFLFTVVDVRTQNLPEGLVLLTNKPQVDVYIVGPQEVMDDFKKQNRHKNLTAFVDVSNAQAGTADFRAVLEPRKELAGLEFKDGPPLATLEFEEKSDSFYAVEVVTGGDPPPGFEFGSATVRPAQVRLVGPRSAMDDVGTVRTLVSLSKVRPGGSVSAEVEVLDRKGKAITSQFRVIPSSVDVTPALSPAQPRRTLLVSPRYSGALAAGLQLTRVTVSPPELRVQGDRASISGQSILETEAIDLSTVARTQTVVVKVKLPPGIRLERIRGQATPEVRVTLTVQPAALSPVPPPSP